MKTLRTLANTLYLLKDSVPLKLSELSSLIVACVDRNLGVVVRIGAAVVVFGAVIGGQISLGFDHSPFRQKMLSEPSPAWQVYVTSVP